MKTVVLLIVGCVALIAVPLVFVGILRYAAEHAANPAGWSAGLAAGYVATIAGCLYGAYGSGKASR